MYLSSGGHYNKVYGWASGYQRGSPDGFRRITDDFDYFDGLSITHGNPRQHIWTYAVGVTGSGTYHSNCPCADFSGVNSLSFVGSNYYCESGANSSWSTNLYYMSDVLWDGAGCSTGNNCCSSVAIAINRCIYS